MLHPTAIIESKDIGEGTKVWAHSHIRQGAKIGVNCTIGEGVYIDTGVIIGDRCRIQNGSQLFSGVTIGNDVLIAPCVVTTNDHFPELPVVDWSHRFRKTNIKDNVSVGANATIICGVTLNENCMIGAGSVVTKDVQENEIWYGNPAMPMGLKSKFKKLELDYSVDNDFANYILGWVDGEGSFAECNVKDKKSVRKSFNFCIESDYRDKKLYLKIVDFFGCGNIYERRRKTLVNKLNTHTISYRVSSYKDLMEKIIPFFDNYNLIGFKKIKYQRWRERFFEYNSLSFGNKKDFK